MENNDKVLSTVLPLMSLFKGETGHRVLEGSLACKKTQRGFAFRFIFMSKSNSGEKYVLMWTDDLSGHVLLKPAVENDVVATTERLTNWFSTFGVGKTWCRKTYLGGSLCNLAKSDKEKWQKTLNLKVVTVCGYLEFYSLGPRSKRGWCAQMRPGKVKNLLQNTGQWSRFRTPYHFWFATGVMSSRK